MTKEYILDLLKENKEDMITKFGVEKIGLFGSYATGKATKESDIDIYVELRENKFRKLAGLWVFLDELYNGFKVDMVNKHRHSKGEIFKHIQKETILI